MKKMHNHIRFTVASFATHHLQYRSALDCTHAMSTSLEVKQLYLMQKLYIVKENVMVIVSANC